MSTFNDSLRSIKSFVNGILPKQIVKLKTQYKIEKTQNRFKNKELQETFTTIYEENIWGGSKGEYYSGTGSDDRIAEEYSQNINRFIQSHHIDRVLDLGCGDFRVASKIVATGIDYIGVDIVDAVIRSNNERYANDRVRFQCLDITKDALPVAKLCLVRQVLQHLSNDRILSALANLDKQDYDFVLITEHIPMGKVEFPNQDIPNGPYTRVFEGSGLFLDQPPFNRQVKTLFEIPDPEMTGILRTVILEK